MVGNKKGDIIQNMTMDVKLLKILIELLPDDMPVFVGCQGYTNYDFKKEAPCEDTDTYAIVHEGKLFITDECAVETADGKTI